MCVVQDVIEYPAEGFAILRGSQGSFLAFRDKESFEPLDDDPDPVDWPKSWKAHSTRSPSSREALEEEFAILVG